MKFERELTALAAAETAYAVACAEKERAKQALFHSIVEARAFHLLKLDIAAVRRLSALA